jgi:CTP:molybdopterin cytidylyltransferase MocA
VTGPEGIAALILCAGRSTRMGTPKALLPLGAECAVERIVRLFRVCGVEKILAVTGHEAERIAPVLAACGVPCVRNADYDRGMFSSLQTGAERLQGLCRAFFVLPADIPLVRPETLRLLTNAFEGGKILACRPSFGGRRGHPPLLAHELVGPILAFNRPGGLRALLADRAGDVVDVACDDPGILFDLDTPQDYAEALNRLEPLRDGSR